MKKAILTAVLAGLTVLAQEAPHGEGTASHAATAKQGEEHASTPNPNEIWWKWANFVILAGGLAWLISKYAGPYFRERTVSITAGIHDAARVREEAEARAAAIEQKVGNLAGEVENLRQQSKAEIAREGERVAAETAAQIGKIRAQAQADIASAGKHATLELRAYSAKLALELAERQIRERVTQPVQDELADSFVNELKNKAVMN